MLFERVGHDNDFIQMYQADFSGQPGEYQIDQSLEQRQCVGETETEYFEPKSSFSCNKSCLIDRCRVDCSLPYPDRRSMLLKNFDPPSESRQVSILGKGYESL